MEAALRKLMEDSFGDYVSGGLSDVNISGFPLTLRDLKLNEKKIREDMEEDSGGKPFELSSGKIGSVTVNPGWLGVEVVASNIVLNFSFNAVKAMNWMMRREEPDEEESAERQSPEHEPIAAPAPPPAPVAPRYCASHCTSEKRVKTEPRLEECKNCGLRLQTNYADFAYCPPCSEKLERCMLCGSNAPTAGSYVPAQHLQQSATGAGAERDGAAPPTAAPPVAPPRVAPPRFCAMHDSSEKRTKAEPQQMECTECHVVMQTNYAEFSLCPGCSDRQERCMICGANAPVAGSYVPAARTGEATEDVPSMGTVGRPDLERAPHAELGEEDATPCRRPLPQGGWRDGSRPLEKQQPGCQMGCGLPCAVGGAGGDGMLGFLQLFDFRSWSQCSADAPGLRRDLPEERSPGAMAPWRGGA